MRNGETVTVRLTDRDKTKLISALSDRMHELSRKPFDYEALDLGFDLPANWPADSDDSPTLAQLTVLACKLKMVIRIKSLELVPREKVEKEAEEKEQARLQRLPARERCEAVREEGAVN